MDQPGLLVSENVSEPILALAEAACGQLELTTLKEGSAAQPCQVGSLGLRIQGPSLPPTKKLRRRRHRWITAASIQWCSGVFFQTILHVAGLALRQGAILFFLLCAMNSVCLTAFSGTGNQICKHLAQSEENTNTTEISNPSGVSE